MALSQTYVTDPAPQAYVTDTAPEQHTHGLSGERLFMWAAMILALAFWVSYVVFVEGAMLGLI